MRRVAGVALVLAVVSGGAAQAQAWEFGVIVYGIPTSRDASVSATDVASGSGTMSGGELALRRSWVGASVRLVNGELSASSGPSGAGGKLATGEFRVQIGPRVASLDVGYGMRAAGGNLGTTTYSYVRVGAATIIDVGDTGLAGRLSVGIYIAGQGVPNTTVSGQEIMSALEYRVRRSPFVITLGYRAEVFQTTLAGVVRAEQLSGIMVGAGIRLTR